MQQKKANKILIPLLYVIATMLVFFAPLVLAPITHSTAKAGSGQVSIDIDYIVDPDSTAQYVGGDGDGWAIGEATFIIDFIPPTNIAINTITADSATQLTVTSETATDSPAGLNVTPYWFAETTGNTGATSSADWQASTAFTDTGLLPNTLYTYKVKARDNASTPNVSDYSSTMSKYTLAEAPTNLVVVSTIPTSVSLSVDEFPNYTQANSGYYFAGSSGHNSGWIQTNTWQDTGLSCGITYTYTIKYRNAGAVETSSISTSQAMGSCGGGNAMQVFAPPKTATVLPAGLPSNDKAKDEIITEIKVKLIDLIRQLIMALQRELNK